MKVHNNFEAKVDSDSNNKVSDQFQPLEIVREAGINVTIFIAISCWSLEGITYF